MLTNSQLLLLDNLIYLNNVANKSNNSVGSIVNYLLANNGALLDQSKDSSGNLPCKMSRDEWLTVLNQIRADTTLCSYTLKMV